MSLPITRKMLIDWAGAEVLKNAESMVERGQVIEANYDPPELTGSVLVNNRPLKTSLRVLPDGNAESHCPCWANRERGMICAHVIALGVTMVKRATDPMREAKYREEMRRASRLATVDESEYITRVPHDSPGAIPAKLVVALDESWTESAQSQKVHVSSSIECRGKSLPVDEVPRDIPLCFDKKDEALLFVLEDISEGPAKGELVLNQFDLVNIIRLHAGRTMPCTGGKLITVNEARMTTFLRMDLDRENGELILIAHTELPFMKAGEFPLYIIAGRDGWVYGADNLWPLENLLPEPYHSIYEEPVVLKRTDVLGFLRRELPLLEKHARIESDINLDLFSIEPASPRFRLLVKGSPVSMAATLFTIYGDIELIANKPDSRGEFAVPDPEDLMRYTVRNEGAEKEAQEIARGAGFSGECGDDMSSIVGKREVLNFLGTHMPALRRAGWRVDLEGRVSAQMDSLDFATPVVNVSDSEGSDWFDVGFDFEYGEGISLSHSDVQLALRMGDSFVTKGGRTILIDSDAVNSMLDVFSDCATAESSEAGRFRMSSVYGSFVKSSLDSLDGIDVESSKAWLARASRQNRSMKIEPVEVGEPLAGVLRSYQKDGVSWLRFLETHGFCGLLADEMGLGKTVQTLAWLNLTRLQKDSNNKPALIVCPTSLVGNWADEAARFVPDMSVLDLTGPDRHNRWSELDEVDLAITSYAILRRDVDRLVETEFSALVLDEAQHIKNRSTQNALSAKMIRADHRLVLTGTPMENSVSDLWSIMDFLMPGYLGAHDAFKTNYEVPIQRDGAEGRAAQDKLRRKIHPFLLRRLKTQVAKDLPPRITKVSFCPLTADQKIVYTEMLEQSRRRISNMVSKKGFNRCRMEILTTLLRLRQICCHLDLLKLQDLKPKFPSAKLDMFFELLDEALDGGHRMLVFSQFVSMLHILRDELARRDVDYCYLDGSTKNRLEVVRQFNTQREIPVFLISLKAGGTGLNLTGADMVVHFDPWWNPAVEDQATDRAHRIGQKRTVYSVKLITRDTVEEKVLEMQRKKKALINATVESDKKMMQSMTWDDVRQLLSL